MSHFCCPICGHKYERWSRHKCNERTLAAIDRAMSQDRDVFPSPTESQRLADGFAMLDDSDPPDREYDAIKRDCE